MNWYRIVLIHEVIGRVDDFRLDHKQFQCYRPLGAVWRSAFPDHGLFNTKNIEATVWHRPTLR
jgi:hypothetical protein